MIVAPGNASVPQFHPQGEKRTFIIILGILMILSSPFQKNFRRYSYKFKYMEDYKKIQRLATLIFLKKANRIIFSI